MGKPKSFRAKILRAGGWILLLAVVVEGLLQIAAYVAWTKRHSGETRSAGDGPVVLCVGDSMTYGLGSTSGGSYPAQLERMLRERDGRDWVVVNGGYPGRNSQQVARLLPDQLERFHPDYVCLLVGTNDWWSRPQAGGGDEESFSIVWRTGRLIDILLVGRLAEHGEEEFVGIWHKDGVEVHFQPTGRMLYADAELRWETRGRELVVVMPDQEEVSVEWRVDGDRLYLQSTIWEEEQVLARGPVTELPPLVAAQRALAEARLDDAKAAFDAVVAAGGADRHAAREGLVAVYLAQGERDRAMELVAQMRSVIATGVVRAGAEALAHAQLAVGDVDDAIVTAARLVGAHPDSDRGWEVLIKHGIAQGRGRDVVAAIDAAVPKLPAGHEWRAHLLVQRGLIVKQDDPVGFLRSLFAGSRAGALDTHIVNHIHLGRDVLGPDVLERALAVLVPAPDATEAARLEALYERGLAGGEDVSGVIVQHLESIIARCRTADAEPLLLDYPFGDLDHEKLVDTVATAKGIRRVLLRARFEKLLETKTRDDLFIRDDVHCNDVGYAEMAGAVRDVLLQ